MTSSPFARDNRFALLSTDDDDDNRGSCQPFTNVRSRNKRRQRSSPERQEKQQQQSSTSAGGQQKQATQSRRAPIVFGKSTTSLAITAAKKIRKK